MTKINLVRGEEKTLKFTVVDDDGVIVDLTGATLTLYLTTGKDTTAVVTKADATFNKADAATGIIKVTLSSSDTNREGYFYGLLKIVLDENNTDKYYFAIDFEESAN